MFKILLVNDIPEKIVIAINYMYENIKGVIRSDDETESCNI